MPLLRELQRDFARATLGALQPDLAARVVGAGLDPRRRIGIYRNNVHHALHQVLAGNFPATRRVAGDKAFDAAAIAFLRNQPPAAPQLIAWGGEFPSFLSCHPATRELPWLADLARLEWAREEAYYAADSEVLRPEALAVIPVERYPDLRFALHGTTVLLSSTWPIHAMWQGRDPPDGTPDPERVLVARPWMEVRTEFLTSGEHRFLAGLSQGQSLAIAADAALAQEPDLDLTALLAGHLARGVFATVS